MIMLKTVRSADMHFYLTLSALLLNFRKVNLKHTIGFVDKGLQPKSELYMHFFAKNRIFFIRVMEGGLGKSKHI